MSVYKNVIKSEEFEYHNNLEQFINKWLQNKGKNKRIKMKELLKELKRHARQFNTHERANTAWASATAGELDALLFVELAKELERHARPFNAGPSERSQRSWGPMDGSVALL